MGSLADSLRPSQVEKLAEPKWALVWREGEQAVFALVPDAEYAPACPAQSPACRAIHHRRHYARMPDADVMGASVQSFDTGQSVEGTARGIRRICHRDITAHLVMNIAAQRNRSGFLELLRACLVSSVQVNL